MQPVCFEEQKNQIRAFIRNWEGHMSNEDSVEKQATLPAHCFRLLHSYFFLSMFPCAIARDELFSAFSNDSDRNRYKTTL
jgi:hypothetical protein